MADNRHLVAITLAELADRDYSRELLDQAVALWDANVATIPRAEDTQRWVQVTNSVGVAYMTIGEKEDDAGAYRKAEALFLSVADVPSARRGRTRGSDDLAPVWTQQSHFRNYVTALTNLVPVRERLAADDRSLSRLYANLDDLRAIDPGLLAGQRSTESTLAYLRGQSAMALWRSTRLQAHKDEALASVTASADGFAAIDDPTTEAHALTVGAQFALSSASVADALDDFRRAEGLASRALDHLPPDLTDVRVIAWRLRAEARLAAAAWRRDHGTLSRISDEIDDFVGEKGTNFSPVQRGLLQLAKLDAQSAMARIDGSADAYRSLLAALDRFPDEAADGSALTRIKLEMGKGHAHRALGDLDRAIAAWANLQDAIWTSARPQLTAMEADPITVGIGQTDRALATGGGLSLADELAVALVLRGSSGDVRKALSVLDRGRAIAAAGRRATTSAGRRILGQIRHVEGRLEAALRDRAFHTSREGGGRPRQSLAELERRKSELEARLRAAETGDASIVGVLDALPAETALAVVALGEREGALILLERSADDTARETAIVLPSLNRRVVDDLLMGRDRDDADLLGAVEALRAIDGGGHVSTEAFLAVADALNRAVADAEAVLAPSLLGPAAAAISPSINRIGWLLPGALWSFPLHAMRFGGSGRTMVQSYLRSLRDIRPRPASAFETVPSILVFDAFHQDGGATPFREDRLRAPIYAGKTLYRVHGRARGDEDLARPLAKTDFFFFNGHGRYVAFEPDRSGLVGSEGELLLSTSALRRLPVRERRLAIISACDVGTIDLLQFPEEFIGLPGELLDLGFGQVVAATWPVARTTTADLIGRFVTKLPEAINDPAVALASAQREFARSGIESASAEFQKVSSGIAASPSSTAAHQVVAGRPFWWAGFRAIGL